MKTMILKTFIIIFSILTLTPSFSTTIREITQAISQGNTKKAKALYGQVDKKTLKEDETLLLNGMLSANADSSELYYKELSGRFPHSPYAGLALLKIGQKRYIQGLYHSSQLQLKKILLLPSHSQLKQEAQYWIGLCFLATDSPDSAQIWFNKSSHISPDSRTGQLAIQENQNLQFKQTHKDTDQPKTYYAIQVGAFSSENNANLRKSYFQREGYKGKIKDKNINGKKLYLVWIGEYNTRTDAMAANEKIKARYGIKSHLVSGIK